MVFIFLLSNVCSIIIIYKNTVLSTILQGQDCLFVKNFNAKKALAKAKLFDKAHGVSYIVFVCGYGEMADALVSGTSGSNLVQVQVLLSAPFEI